MSLFNSRRAEGDSLQARLDAVKANFEKEKARNKKAMDRFGELTNLARQEFVSSNDQRSTRIQEILDEIEAERYFGTGD